MMPIDHERINEFVSKSSTRNDVARVVRGAGFEIAWAEDYRPGLWSFKLKLNRPLRQILGFSREILVWVAEFPDFQARTVMQAMQHIVDNRPRLSEDFAVIISGDSNCERYVDETADQLAINFIGFSLADMRTFKPLGSADFIATLQSRFFAKDLYGLSTAITSQSAFFGRRSLIQEILSHLQTGTSHIGLFGLRKMGKTSFLFRLLESLKSNSLIFSAHLDIQRLDAISPTATYFLWSLGEQLIDSNTNVRRIPGFRMFGKYATFSEVPREAVFELFDNDLRLIISHGRQRIILLLDEIELMSPDFPGSEWKDSFIRVWRLLRGLDQQHPGRLGFFVTGTNPRCIEANRLDGRENPIYNYFARHFLPSLTESECKEMLLKLGLRMGLDWNESAMDRLIEYVGGHPFLLRAFASRVHRSLLPRREKRDVTLSIVEGSVEGFLVDMNSSFSQMIEVLDDHYPDEFMLLETLALGKVGEYRELARAFPNDIAHLTGYGLVGFDAADVGLNVELLQTWLQRRNQERFRVTGKTDIAALKPGSDIEGYTIISSVGLPGGFASVYKAKKIGENSGFVAIKLLKNCSLAALQREIDVLRDISHPNVVKFIDHGKHPGGSLFLTMEFLDGSTLRQYCQRATRLVGKQALEATKRLLDALTSIHPDEETLSRLRRKAELSVEDLETLNRARHGYIHRDIKPENIIMVPNRGPVLIDFNISVRVAEPVRTISATPGYLPPDGLPGRWSPDIDLFQLGVTMLQAATGLAYDGGNLQDLRSVAQEALDSPLCQVLLRLSEKERQDRYTSAREALGDLES